MKHQAIRKLTPAAARLLLAFLARREGDTFDAIVARSGIDAYETMCKAKAQLVEYGFLEYHGLDIRAVLTTTGGQNT